MKHCFSCGKAVEIKKDSADARRKLFESDGKEHWCDRTKANPQVVEIKLPGIEEAVRMIVRDELKRMKA